MAFLKTIFWVIIAVIVVLLWQTSPRVDLPIGSEETNGLIINSRLGTWIIISFLVGFVPLYIYHRTVKWRLKRRVKTLEAQVTSHSRAKALEAEKAATDARKREEADAETQAEKQQGETPATEG